VYDPFARGPFSVGVRSDQLQRGARPLPIEVWYPADGVAPGADRAEDTRDHYDVIPGFPRATQDAVRDAALRPGRHPLVAFSHGYGGHRRQSTFLCTHLASHGYVVAAVDHTGNTVLDVMQTVLAVQTGQPVPDAGAVLREFVELRPADVVFMLDGVLEGAGDVAGAIDAERIGMAGHSFGGWTTLTATARDRRIRAALPLAPAAGSNPIAAASILAESVELAWGRDVPTLFVVADRDTLLPLAGMHELLERTSGTRRMVVLENADHMHFCDRVEEIHELFRLMPQDPLFAAIQAAIPPIGELCPGEHAHDAIRGLGLAHMDTHLCGDERAARFLAGDVRGAVGARGIKIAVVP
jgi:predicted dienelactone hydrolase